MVEFYSEIIILIIILLGIFIISFIKPVTKIVKNKARGNRNRFWLSILLGIDHLVLLVVSKILEKPDIIICCAMTIMWFVAAIFFRAISKNRWD